MYTLVMVVTDKIQLKMLEISASNRIYLKKKRKPSAFSSFFSPYNKSAANWAKPDRSPLTSLT